MNSMTGFARAQGSLPQVQIAIEIKSYNNRYLEPCFHLPPELSILENWSREQLSQQIYRGKVNILVKITRSMAANYILDAQKVQIFENLLQQLQSKNIHPHYSLSDLHNYGVFEENTESDLSALYQQVFSQALSDLKNSRKEEGESLYKDLQKQIQIMKQLLSQIKTLEKQADEQSIINLREKFRACLGEPIPEQRVMEEIAAYLIKINIHEEIIRLETHICSLEKLIDDHEPIGRKIDFLCQELQREITTLSNKTPCTDLQQIGVEMKNIIEKIREQARNVE